jgi:hypothetical protein
VAARPRSTCGFGSDYGSVSGADPKLGYFADNGGPTWTFAVLVGSPAINGVTYNAPNGAPSTDQRGVVRPQGGWYDIGAFESQAQSGPAFIVNATSSYDDGSCDLLGQGIGGKDCTLPEAINAANAHTGADTITFSLSGAIALVSTLPAIADAAGLTIDGTDQTVTISGGGVMRVLWVNAGAALSLNHLTITGGTPGLYSFESGGGLYNNGTLIITNSAFSGNSAGGLAFSGGGGAIFNNGGTASITNSTFSGNTAAGIDLGKGGGMFNNGGIAGIANSTFAGNAVGAYSSGGGIYNTGTVTLSNTIMSGNAGGNCAGAITNGGNNIDSASTCGWVSANGSMRNTDPLLGSATGSPAYFPLLPGSPAIDGVTYNAPNGAPSTDQRGLARPQGVRYDIGAFELEIYSIYLPLVVRF